MRLALATIGIIGVFISPWAPLIMGTLLAIRYRAWEVTLMGILIDVLWLPSDAFFGLPVATLGALALVWMLEPVRRELLLGRGAL